MKHVRRVCDECPFRRDAQSGRFTEERWESLRETSQCEQGFGPEFGSTLFACHKTPEGGERACAGWLAVEGSSHPVVRLDLMTGKLPPSVLESDVPLFDSFIEAMNHDLGTPES